MKKSTFFKIFAAVVLLAALTAAAVFLFGRMQNKSGCEYDYTYRVNGKKLTVSIERSETDGYEWTASCSKSDFFEITSELVKDKDTFVFNADKTQTGSCSIIFELNKGVEAAYQIRLDVLLGEKKLEVQSEGYVKPEAPVSGGEEDTGIAYDILMNTDGSLTLQFYQEKISSESEAETDTAEEKKTDFWNADAPENVQVQGPQWNDAGPYFLIRNDSSGLGLPGENTVLFTNEAFDGQVSVAVTEDESGMGLQLVQHEVIPAEA